MEKTLDRLFGVLEQQTGRPLAKLGYKKGATDKQIDALVKAVPFELPKDLLTLLRRVNGQDDTATILPCAKLQSAKSIAEEWEELDSNVDEEEYGGEFQDEDKIKLYMATNKWIPLAWDYESGGGFYHYIDLDPGPKGKPGQILEAMSECDFQVVADSLEELFQRITKCFETGSLYYPKDEPGFPLFYTTDEYWEALRDAEI